VEELLQYIADNSVRNTQEIQKGVANMICHNDSPIPLSESDLLSALKLDGEFLVLKLAYSDFEDEMKSHLIKYKISQALSVVISYEDDGESYNDIREFVEYVYENSDDKQNSTFGIKNVEKLSEFPVTILFSGILPINQLRMSIGKKVEELIHSDDAYFIPRFQAFRDKLSREVGVPILPVLPMYDEYLEDYQIRLVDMTDGRVISDFEVAKEFSKKTIEAYLLKLFYIYKVLLEEKNES